MNTKRYLRIKNFEETQHYKDRNPIWIKMRCSLLEDYDFASMPDLVKLHTMSLMLLAPRLNNKLPDNERWLRQKINTTKKINLEYLIDAGFLEVVEAEKSSEARENEGFFPPKSNKTQDEPASASFDDTLAGTSEGALAQNRTQQNRLEQNTTEQIRTQQNTAEQHTTNARALQIRTDCAPDAENKNRNAVAAWCDDAEFSENTAAAAVVGDVLTPVKSIIENRRIFDEQATASAEPRSGHAKTSRDGSAGEALSEFSLEECLRYVSICQTKGESIRNPQGLAVSLHKTGKSDAFIRAALFPARQSEVEKQRYGEPVEFSDEPCSICYGAKMEIVPGKGARHCRHCCNERGNATGREPIKKAG
jgi:hypothetical protein